MGNAWLMGGWCVDAARGRAPGGPVPRVRALRDAPGLTRRAGLGGVGTAASTDSPMTHCLIHRRLTALSSRSHRCLAALTPPHCGVIKRAPPSATTPAGTQFANRFIVDYHGGFNMAGVFQEFKQFAIKGNVMDLAVGVIIGGAFSTIVNSIVKDLIMPIVGIVSGDIDFSNKFVRLGQIPATFKGNPDSYKDLQSAGVAVFGYGSFVTVVLNFVILAFIVFLIVKFINRLRELDAKPAEAAPAAPPPPPEDVLLLREIRDELKQQQRA
jgi:large conductance mechanosensitive channel